MTFAFDERYAMFDVTPVENQFILEYMPGAKSDYVKVYLYGLLCCYHPRKEMDVASMSRELGLAEDVILAAFRYWERRGIVRRISDNPPSWQFINIKQNSMGEEQELDREYIRFSRDLESSFEDIRDLYGNEIAACYEWKEEMGLSTEVIIMLLKYMARTRGKNFKIRDAEKAAILLSEEKAYTVEDAELVLGRDEELISGFRKIQRKLGMRFNPSDANLKLYRKWREEWHCTQEIIEDACDRTGTSTPSLALVDSILEQAFRNSSGTEQLKRTDLEASEENRKNLKKLLKEIGQYGAATPAQQKTYESIAKIYSQEIIMLAAQECAAKQKQFDSVVKLLESWQQRGFTNEKQIREHIGSFHEKEEFLKTLWQKWSGQDMAIGQKSLQLLDRWENGMGFSREMISLAADAAYEAKKPITYMDKLLTGWNEQGIRTPEAVKNDRKTPSEASGTTRRATAKTVPAQQYNQRDYEEEQEDAMKRMLSGVTSGGDYHA